MRGDWDLIPALSLPQHTLRALPEVTPVQKSTCRRPVRQAILQVSCLSIRNDSEMAMEQTCSFLLCILCISEYFLPICGTLVFHESSNILEYRNASMGHTVNGVVSQHREQVWLYSWINKTEVNLVDDASINFTVRFPQSLIQLYYKAVVPLEI